MKVTVGGTVLEIQPRTLLDYVEKVDFIKMRRGTTYDLVRGFPTNMTEENYKILVGIAMTTVCRNSSSVGIQEELSFDTSEEGFFWTLWRCMPKQTKVKKLKVNGEAPVVEETWQDGINRAKRLWESATDEEKTEIRLALAGTDESSLAKNSAGPNPSETNPEAPGQTS